MIFTRVGYQQGSLRKINRKSGSFVWEFRYRDNAAAGRPQRQMTLDGAEYATEAQARRQLEAVLWKINSETARTLSAELSFGALADLFIADEQLEDIAQLKAGED